MISVGIIGTGKIAGLYDKPGKIRPFSTHAQAIFNNKDLELVSIVDPDKKSLEKFRKIWNVKKTFLTIDDFLKEELLPDIVSICTPNETHFNIAVRLLKHSKPPRLLFIEKPLVTASGQLKEMVNLAEKKICTILVNHKRRLDPAHQKLFRIISSGEIGIPLKGSFTYYGGWLNNGVHLIDLIIMLFGCDFTFGDVVIQEYGKGEDHCIETTMKYGNFKVFIDSVDEKYYQLFEGEFRFTKGRVLYRNFGNEIIIEKVIKNDIGELELRQYRNCILKGLGSPLEYSYLGIVQYLMSGDASGIKGVTFQDVKIVMDNIFNIKMGR